MLAKTAVLCGKSTIQVRELGPLPIGDDELLVRNILNSTCLSTYKAVLLGEDHKCVPDNINEHSPITGHEFTGIIMEVGNHLKDRSQPGRKFVLQSAMGFPSGYPAGYSYECFGGNATYCVIPRTAIDLGCVLLYQGNHFANTSLSESMSCIIGACHAVCHTKQYVYEHFMGIKEQGKLAPMGCAGPTGIGATNYAVNGPVSSKLIVVTDIDEQRLECARILIPEEATKKQGKALIYINMKDIDVASELRKPSRGTGFDDVFVFAAVPALLKQADAVLGNDGCLSFFAGPTDKQFAVPFNFYNVHYEGMHTVGTSGGLTQDMLECLTLSAENKLNPSYMITHIGRLQAAPETILDLPDTPGGKRLTHPHIDLSLTAIENLRSRQSENPLSRTLTDTCERNHNVWCEGVETYLLEYYQV